MIYFDEAFRSVLAALDRAEIPFVVGGSIASGIHGVPRQTNDVDILIQPTRTQLKQLVELLDREFYVDLETAVDAVKSGRSFNAIHRHDAVKFDFFPALSAFEQREISRTVWSKAIEGLEFPVASAEDTILAKLVWFRRGGEVSDRQWHDILGILKIQGSRLDQAYLSEWSRQLQVDDLLVKAQAQI